MRAWRDMAYPPTDAQIAEFKAAGVAGLAGYFKFGNDGVLNGWLDSDFERVIAGGLGTLAFCSGWAPPDQCLNRAASLGIQPWLDDEPGMRAHGSWTQPWLLTANAGQYGNAQYHAGMVAPLGHIVAGYFGYDPRSTWPSWLARPPAGPYGWQWQGTHNEFGVSDDSDWFDDAIGGLHGAGGGSITEGVAEMVYVGPFHKLAAPVVLTVYVDGADYRDPFPVFPLASVAKGATIQVDGYVYCSMPVQSTIPAGSDFVMWHATSGQWVPDAILNTQPLAGAPAMAPSPAEAAQMKLYFAKETELAGLSTLTVAQVDSEIAKAIAGLPKYATEQEMLTAIATAVGQLPGGHHKHEVLGVIATSTEVAA